MIALRRPCLGQAGDETRAGWSPAPSARRKDTVGILNRLLGRKNQDLSQTDRYRKVSSDPLVSDEQKAANRATMEAQMDEARARRDSTDRPEEKQEA